MVCPASALFSYIVSNSVACFKLAGLNWGLNAEIFIHKRNCIPDSPDPVLESRDRGKFAKSNNSLKSTIVLNARQRVHEVRVY